MEAQNEFSRYSLPQLEKKKKYFRTVQMTIPGFALIAAAVLLFAGISKENNQVFFMIPIFLSVGFILPLMVFVPLRKKIQLEIDSRTEAG